MGVDLYLDLGEFLFDGGDGVGSGDETLPRTLEFGNRDDGGGEFGCVERVGGRTFPSSPPSKSPPP